MLSDNYLNEGGVTRQFEDKLAELLGVRQAVTATSGTTSLFLALYAMGVGHGHEVLVPDVTFVASANAVTMTGARPVLVDVSRSNLMIDLQAAQRALTDKTRAIMPVHVSGRPAPMDEILEFASENGLAVLEDAAEGLLSKYRGRYLGTLGQAGCFSFSPNKTITTGQGGAVVTNDSELADRLRRLKDQGRPVRGTGGADQHDHIGFNFKFTNLQAAVGLAQLSYLQERAHRMTANYRLYQELLGDLSEVTFLEDDPGTVPQWTDVLCDRRDELFQYLAQHEMHCRKFWHPMHTHQPYRRNDQDFPVSTELVPRALWLPSAFQLTQDDVRAVCAEVRSFYGR